MGIGDKKQLNKNYQPSTNKFMTNILKLIKDDSRFEPVFKTDTEKSLKNLEIILFKYHPYTETNAEEKLAYGVDFKLDKHPVNVIINLVRPYEKSKIKKWWKGENYTLFVIGVESVRYVWHYVPQEGSIYFTDFKECKEYVLKIAEETLKKIKNKS